MVHGADDRLVSAEEAVAWSSTSAPTTLNSKVYPELFHEVFNEPERDRVLDDVTEWITARI